MLKQRVITALVLVLALLLIAFYANALVFLIFITAVSALAAWEWSALASLQHKKTRLTYSLIFLAFLLWGIYQPLGYQSTILLAAIVFWVLAFVFILLFPGGVSWWDNRGLLMILGLVVIFPCWQGLIVLQSNEHFAYSFLGLFLLVGAADSGAYFAGKSLGVHKLAEQVSPNKTWEGVLGGFICCAVISLLYAFVYQLIYEREYPWAFALLCPLMITLFSVTGDLFESMLKRVRHLKDSGNLLPGHGGILDRIDGVLAAAPVYLLITELFL